MFTVWPGRVSPFCFARGVYSGLFPFSLMIAPRGVQCDKGVYSHYYGFPTEEVQTANLLRSVHASCCIPMDCWPLYIELYKQYLRVISRFAEDATTAAAA